MIALRVNYMGGGASFLKPKAFYMGYELLFCSETAPTLENEAPEPNNKLKPKPFLKSLKIA